MSDQAPGSPREHPEASLVLGLGVLGLAGGLLVLPLFLSPFALLLGRRALAQIDADPASFTGRGKVRAGYLLGLAGSIVLGALVLVLAVLVAISVIDVLTGNGLVADASG